MAEQKGIEPLLPLLEESSLANYRSKPTSAFVPQKPETEGIELSPPYSGTVFETIAANQHLPHFQWCQLWESNPLSTRYERVVVIRSTLLAKWPPLWSRTTSPHIGALFQTSLVMRLAYSTRIVQRISYQALKLF
jgi:hypothetical protein